MNSDKFFIGNRSFGIVQADIYAGISSLSVEPNKDRKLIWGIDCLLSGEDFDGQERKPSLSVSIEDLNITNWQQLHGISKDFDQFTTATIYVFDHLEIEHGWLRIRKKSGTSFLVSFDGINEDDESIQFCCSMDFKGVVVRCNQEDNKETVRKSISEIIELSNLMQGQVELFRELPNGERAGTCWFTPVTFDN